jgi:tRNA threonylcarbamoyladenosine biosynthesis protein TsaB
VTKPGNRNYMQERTLVIECATPALSVALIGRGHAEALLPAIAALPRHGLCQAILVDTGPGSFTGVRVGLAAARALSYVWDVPVYGYGCLDLVAAMVRAKHDPADTFIVAMIGGHGELFWQRFRAHPAADTGEPPLSAPIEVLAKQIDDPIIYGSGAASLICARGNIGVAHALLPDSRCTTLLPRSRISTRAAAHYGREADAQPMQKQDK